MTDAPLPSAGELEPDKNQPDLDQFKSVEREMTGFERATLRWAKIAVLLSGLAALFICGQWYEMHTGGQDTRILAEAAKKQADKAETISASLERAVVAMQDANEQGRASLQSAIVNSHVDQRAWLSVGFSSPTGNFAVGKVFDTRITLKNQGKTPAINMRTTTKREPLYAEDGTSWHPSFSYDPKDFVFTGNFLPGVENYADFQSMVTEADIKMLNDPKFRIYYHGRVEYDDLFGAHHWQNFCEFLLTGGGYAICEEHNDMDKKTPATSTHPSVPANGRVRVGRK